MARLTVSDIESLRAQSAPLTSSIAPYTSSDFFKSRSNNDKQTSQPMDHHFSVEARNFHGSALKKMANGQSDRKVISLGTGRPIADYYPWESLTFHGSRPHLLTTTHENGLQTAGQTVRKEGNPYNLSTALNYGHAVGSPPLVRFLSEHVELIHNPPYADWSVLLSPGSTAAMETALRIFCNRGDTILAERYTYTGFIAVAGLVGVQIEAVDMNEEGLRPESFQKILSEWDTSRGRKPSVLYTIPTGQNPTGTTQSAERRQAIYDIAEQHDLIIIEDDPYYFLRMGSYPSPQDELVTSSTNLPSYLSLDKSGRVVRLDSTSKVLSPGLRAGWVTANTETIGKFIEYQDVTTGSASGPSQLMLWTLLEESWGHNGFALWLHHLSAEYRSRRDILLDACELYLPKDICEWVPPQDGMFLWVSLNWKEHPLFRALVKVESKEHLLSKISDRIDSNAVLSGVQVTKGLLFNPNKKPNGALQFRMTFAAASREDLEEGVRIFGDVVRKEFNHSLG